MSPLWSGVPPQCELIERDSGREHADEEKANKGRTYGQVCAGKVHVISTINVPGRRLTNCTDERPL